MILALRCGLSLPRTLAKESSLWLKPCSGWAPSDHEFILGISILKMKTVKFREVKQFAQGHTACELDLGFKHKFSHSKVYSFLHTTLCSSQTEVHPQTSNCLERRYIYSLREHSCSQVIYNCRIVTFFFPIFQVNGASLGNA